MFPAADDITARDFGQCLVHIWLDMAWPMLDRLVLPAYVRHPLINELARRFLRRRKVTAYHMRIDPRLWLKRITSKQLTSLVPCSRAPKRKVRWRRCPLVPTSASVAGARCKTNRPRPTSQINVTRLPPRWGAPDLPMCRCRPQPARVPASVAAWTSRH